MISMLPFRNTMGVLNAAETKRSTAKKLQIKQFLFTIASTVTVVIGIILAAETPEYVDYKIGLSRSEQHKFVEAPIDPSWITSGTPVFHAVVFEHSPHWGTQSGIWECIGPAKFVWHYSVDEVIYVLEGSAEIEYLGSKFTLHAGDSTRFVAGTVATWVVTDRVKKTFRIQNPGPLIKAMRVIFGYFDLSQPIDKGRLR
jgi:uncharacterized cupin superfamily protein